MTSAIVEVLPILLLLLGSVCVTRGRPVALSIQPARAESVQNTMHPAWPRPLVQAQQKRAQESAHNVIPQVAYPRAGEVQNVPKLVPWKVFVAQQEQADYQLQAVMRNHNVASVADECTGLYNWCINSGEYDTFFCLGAYVACVAQ